MVVFVVEKMQLSFRVSFFAATCFNALIMLLAPWQSHRFLYVIPEVRLKWRDVAPRKDYTCEQTNPFAGIHLLGKNKAMVRCSTTSCFISTATHKLRFSTQCWCSSVPWP